MTAITDPSPCQAREAWLLIQDTCVAHAATMFRFSTKSIMAIGTLVLAYPSVGQTPWVMRCLLLWVLLDLSKI